MTKSKRLLFFTASFFVGVAMGDPFFISWIVIYCLLVVTTVIYILLHQRTIIRIFCVITFGFLLGVTRMNFENSKEHHNFFIRSYIGKEMMFTGEIVREPDIRDTHQKITVDAIKTEHNQPVRGRALVLTGLSSTYRYRDYLTFTCTLERPEPVENFRYDKYLEQFSIFAICAFPGGIERRENPTFGVSVLTIKYRFIQNILRVLPEPHASLGTGILLGERRGLPTYLEEAFRRVGVTHILALSGFNIAVIVSLFLFLGRTIGVPRRLLFGGILVGLIMFVFMTGASSSVTRAAIMGMVILFAYELGRLTHARNILFLAAFVMVSIHPRILLWDIGFQLSCVATYGLIELMPKLMERCTILPRFYAIREIVTATLSAIIFTLPLSLYYFHGWSLVAVPTNVLIIPLVPFAMLFSFISGVFGDIGVATYLFKIPAFFLLESIISIAELGAMVPLGYVSFQNFSLGGSIALYVGIVTWTYILKKGHNA